MQVPARPLDAAEETQVAAFLPPRKSKFLSHHAPLLCDLSTSGFCVLILPGGNWGSGRLPVFPVRPQGAAAVGQRLPPPEVAPCGGAASSWELCGGSRRVNPVALGRVISTREINGCPQSEKARWQPRRLTKSPTKTAAGVGDVN